MMATIKFAFLTGVLVQRCDGHFSIFDVSSQEISMSGICHIEKNSIAGWRLELKRNTVIESKR